MKRVLIVDDKEENLYYLSALLQGHGLEVERARHGAEALVLARQSPPDLVVSDLLMPVMDGYTLLRHWKADARLKLVPFIVYTATYTEVEDEQLALNLGADAFILKPCEPEDFIARLSIVQTLAELEPPAQPRVTASGDASLLKVYSETLIRKLEEKSLQLEETNRALAQDILKRQQAEAEIRRTTDLLRAVADGLPDAVFVKDREGRYLLFNEGACRLVGRKMEEVIGQDDTAIFSPEDAQLVKERDQRVLETGEMLTGEEVLTAAGVKRVYWATKAPYRDGAGNLIGILGISRDITDRKHAELELLEKQEESRALAARLTATLESLTDGFYTLNRDWCFTYVNAEAERLLKRPRTELLGRSVWSEFPEARGSIVQREYERAMNENSAVQYEIYYEPLSTWFDARAFPSPEGIAVYFRDVTAVRRAAEALRVSEERFRLLSKATNDAIWDWDIGANTIWWNEGLETLFGYPIQEMTPTIEWWAEQIHPDDREATNASIHKAIDDGSASWTGEYCFVCKDGSHAYVLDRGHIIRDAHGKALRMIGGMTDLTERKRAEQKLRQQATLLDKAQDAILVRDLDHRIRYWNRSAERLYGWTAEEVLGRSIKEMLYRDPTEFLAATANVLTLGEWSGELNQVTKDGQPIVIEAHWTLVEDEDGRSKSILAINTDITQRKKLESQFLRAQRMESIGTLAGGIAHDLNNVLAPILMSIDLLRLKIADPDCRETLATIGRSAQRGAEMVSQVLSFARGMEGRRVEVQIRHVIRDMIKIAGDTFPKNIRIEERLANDLWTMEADPTQLHQVLLNLCVNARDAMDDGGMITITAENMVIDDHYAAMNIEARVGPHVRIEVEDTGVGIPRHIIDKIFDPFFTTKEVGKGTGLGLATSLAIVKSHGGFIRVYSDKGIGSKFRIYLPALAGGKNQSPESAEVNLPRGNNETILVVDDEASVRQITKQTLEAFGYRVLLAADGSEAISTYVNHQEEIAVVLTDMMMPVMDGPATIRVLMRLNPHVRIIGASGITANGKVAQSVGIGVKHFLPKPYTAETLLKAIKKVLTSPE